MQNEKTLQQMIREYELNMPPEIMDMINKFDWKRELRTIAMQNQLMADVGTDLEESVYMMLLGVAKVADVYERLIDVHELSEDRTKKVLEEVENKIFNVLHKKLAELEDEDVKKDALVTPTISVIDSSKKVEDNEDRDAILAEIEKDEVTEMIVKPIIKPITETKIEEVKVSPVAVQPLTIGVIAPKTEENKINIIQTPGVAKPFSLNGDKTITTEDTKITVPEVTKGIQADPIASGLNKATVMSAPVINNSTPAPKTSGAPDPYREPIE